jgi:hypothetical protein
MRRRTRHFAVAVVVSIVVAATAAGSAAVAGQGASGAGASTVRERLTGYQEDPAVLSTTGTGRIVLRIDEAAQTIAYRLTYRSLEGNVIQAHIHFGGRAQSGGISVFLCTNAGNGPAGTAACPPAPGTVEGAITPASIIGPTGQGITAGQFDELVSAIRAGVTYANVHSSLYPAGEIRAQLGDHH